VVKLDVGSDEAGEDAGQPWIDQQPREGCRAELNVVRMFKLCARPAHAAPRRIGRSLACRDRVNFHPQCCSFLGRNEAPDQQESILVIEAALIGSEAIGVHWGFL
jgi:hypothetical protein